MALPIALSSSFDFILLEGSLKSAQFLHQASVQEVGLQHSTSWQQTPHAVPSRAIRNSEGTMAAEPLTSGALVATMDSLLPAAEPFPPSKFHLLHRCLTHHSFGPVNHDPLAMLGDIILKMRLTGIFVNEHGWLTFTTAGEVSAPIQAAGTNEVLARIYKTVLKFKSSNIIVGKNYPFAELERSVRTQATCVEALIAVVENVLGSDASRYFVEDGLYRSLLAGPQGKKSFANISVYDPVSSIEHKLAYHMTKQAKHWIEYCESDEPDEKGLWTATCAIKTAPKELCKGPISARKKSDVKKQLFEQLDQDPEVTEFIKKHGKKGKVDGGSEVAAVGGSATDEGEN